MCGIAGFFHLDGRPAERSRVERMVGTLVHRGPDEGGVSVNGPVGLGHRRLSVIDLSGGRQPMSSDDGSVTLVYNGEVFNFVELRQELQRRGHRFRTRSDTEVVLRLYLEWGERFVERLNGQWALAVWDARRRRLFLSRDRLGIRPLYWCRVGQTVYFASEVKALFACPEVPRALDPVGLDQTLTFWAPLAPRTVFSGIDELPPGHCLTVAADVVRCWPYWQLEFDPEPEWGDADEAAERLLTLLVDATRLRLRSDVPVGAYLSGGLDSSLTAALVRRFTDGHLETFSVCFTDPAFDESRFQDEVVGHLKTRHHRLVCRHSDIGRVFPDVVRHAERPVVRTAPAPLFLLSRLVRQRGLKVVVTGEGADEVLGGYDLFKEAKIRRFWVRRPDSRRRAELLRVLYPYLKALQNQPLPYLKAFFHARPEDADDPFFSHLPRWRLTGQLKRFLNPELRRRLAGYDCLEELRERLPADFSRWPPLCQAQYLETVGLLPGYILSSQGDRMAMAHSIEGRFPFLDHRVVEFAARLHPRLKMHGLEEKYLLKRVAREFLPASVLRRPKQPYRAPDAESFFDPAAGAARFEYVEALLSEEKLREVGVFDPRPVQRLVEKARAGRIVGARDNMALVAVLSTQLLHEQLVRQAVVEPESADRQCATVWDS